MRFDRRLACRPAGLLAVVALIQCAPSRADTLTLRTRDGAGSQVRSGEVVDWTGTTLVWRHRSGREERIAADRVLDVESEWVTAHRRADAHFIENDFAAAIEAYRDARRAEKRPWVRRRILARMVRCWRSVGEVERAGDGFLALYQQDAETPAFGVIPLAWTTVQPGGSLLGKAKAWLFESDSEAARLLGASWLLATADRTAAQQQLRRLQNSDHARVADLATAQLWRTLLPTTDRPELERWGARLARMSPDIASGPRFVYARGLSRHARHEEAALAFLRVALLESPDRDLAAHALLAAGRELDTMNRPDKAARLYREVVRDYAESTAAVEAGRLLARRPAPSSPSPE